MNNMSKNDKSTALTTEQSADLLAQWNQQRNVASRPGVNTIFVDNRKFADDSGIEVNADFGKLFAVKYVEQDGEFVEQKTEIDISLAQFHPIKARVLVQCKEYDDATGKPMYSAKEVDEFTDIELRDVNGEIVYTGPYKGAKEEFNLRYIVVLYVEFLGDIYRWKVTGASFDTWFKVRNSMDKLRVPYTFKVNAVESKKSGSVFYNEIIFALGEEYPVQDALDLMKELNSLFNGGQKEKSESVAELAAGVFESDE